PAGRTCAARRRRSRARASPPPPAGVHGRLDRDALGSPAQCRHQAGWLAEQLSEFAQQSEGGRSPPAFRPPVARYPYLAVFELEALLSSCPLPPNEALILSVPLGPGVWADLTVIRSE